MISDHKEKGRSTPPGSRLLLSFLKAENGALNEVYRGSPVYDSGLDAIKKAPPYV
jgi:hypothetical protein